MTVSVSNGCLRVVPLSGVEEESDEEVNSGHLALGVFSCCSVHPGKESWSMLLFYGSSLIIEIYLKESKHFAEWGQDI